MLQKALILLRGLPGAGKSSLANILCENGKYPIHAIDDYFVDSETGKYEFDFSKNYLAYAHCEALTEQSLIKEVDKVFIDNAFTLGWEMEPYFKLAAAFNYTIYVVTVEKYHNQQNVHGVSEEQLAKMAAKYQVKLF